LKTRLKKITSVLIDYSTGHFGPRLRVSKSLDEVDAVIAGINMLGEELQATTISKNYFNNIFNTVSDMIFVVNQHGKIINANKAACDKLGISEERQHGILIDRLLNGKTNSLKRLVIEMHTGKQKVIETETVFKPFGKPEQIPARCTVTFLNKDDKVSQYLVTAHDLTRIKAYEESLKTSEEKYRKLFEESSDFIFICTPRGDILEMNKAGHELLMTVVAAPPERINLFKLVTDLKSRQKLRLHLKKTGDVENTGIAIKSFDGSTAICLLSASAIYDKNNTITGYRGIIKNITLQKESEKKVIRAIIDTQEKERIRFAKDIHDSLGQQLSAIKFYIGTSISASTNKKQRDILNKSNDALVRTLADMRSICFNLMPKTLENFGLVQAIRELCSYPGLQEHIRFGLLYDEVFPELHKNMEIAIFRIIQEFINNALKHGKANKVDIETRTTPGNEIKIILQDNGKGFNTEKINEMNGMGFKNIHSRVTSYNGDIVISSVIGKGTRYEIIFPLNNKKYNYGSNREEETTHQAADR
jgi:PAS domain S-box-containing protein